MDPIHKKFDFNVGLENIFNKKDKLETQLPNRAQSTQIKPSEDQMESFVDKILNKPTFEDMLVSFLKPQITNLAILSPGIYNQLGPELQAIITKLLKDANDKKDNKKKKKFKAAQEILEEEGELRDLLTTYIHTLHQA